MGLLVNGEWRDEWYDTTATGGRFRREDSVFRNWVTADGAPGPTGRGGFKAEAGRYHLYVAAACPWAHRTLIFRALKGLTDMISVTVVEPLMLENGWEIAPGADPVLGATHLHQVYTAAKPDYTGRVTVPALWDRRTGTIVSNESAEIIRMFNSAFDGVGARPGDYYPEDLRAKIDMVNTRVYDTVNNGVYKAGFATAQDAHDDAAEALFDSLDWLEAALGESRYLTGGRVTEADWRLFTTLIRFDAVYVGHFKCNKRRIADYPNLSGYLRELYQWPGVKETVDLAAIKAHYYGSHRTINPSGIIPAGPEQNLDAPHGRDRLTAARIPETAS
ncbi:MAG: glutathione-dependent reductase [Rhodospirillales bacterium CG15_BIG_FIL_POST_REV_8_21_14_020_66_15]|nr:MAG: glutathione-dependent reductase [Rhodospirillales bacterium CG15_BIG_FIL_POST_REV_8_21_14_020_66_15]